MQSHLDRDSDGFINWIRNMCAIEKARQPEAKLTQEQIDQANQSLIDFPLTDMPACRGVPIEYLSREALIRIVAIALEDRDREAALHRGTLSILTARKGR